MLKVKDYYDRVLKEVTCNLRKVLNESVKNIFYIYIYIYTYYIITKT